jgi:multicomponent Na+:H+ antiporter subunit F
VTAAQGVFLYGAAQAAMAILLAGMTLVFWRLVKGPTAADRVIAMDLMSVLVVAFLVVLSIHTGQATYLDVAIAFACIAFLGTIALARFIERASRPADENPNAKNSEGPDRSQGGPHD